MQIAATIALTVLVGAGAQIARSSTAGYTFGIYEIRADGSGRNALLESSEIRSVADVSPDRTRILYITARPNDPGQLFSARIDGTDARPVRTPEGRWIQRAAWSSDGRRIAMEVADLADCGPGSTSCAVGEIWFANAAGATRRLARNAIAPSWSPDSRRLAFFSSFNATLEVGAVSIASTSGRPRPRQLGPKEFVSWGQQQFTWSPRGGRFAYTADRGGRSYVGVVRANAESRRGVRILRAGAFAAWSPGGRRILYWEGRSHRLITARPDGRQRRLLTTGYGPVRWSPDGRWIAFVDAVARGCYQIFLIRPDGRGRRQLTDEACSARFEIFWSRDSKRLIYPMRVYDP